MIKNISNIGNCSSSWTSTRRSSTSNRRRFSHSSIDNRLLDSNFLTESLKRIFSLQFLKFNRSILIQKFINRKVTSTNSDLDVLIFDLDSNSLGSKLINTIRLSHEHNLQLGSLRIIVDKLSQFLVGLIVLHRDIHCDSLLEINNVLF
jgi:hypothetical protein